MARYCSTSDYPPKLSERWLAGLSRLDSQRLSFAAASSQRKSSHRTAKANAVILFWLEGRPEPHRHLGSKIEQ